STSSLEISDGRGEGGAHLEDEHRIRVALGVERKVPGGDLQRGGGFISAAKPSLRASINPPPRRRSPPGRRWIYPGGPTHTRARRAPLPRSSPWRSGAGGQAICIGGHTLAPGLETRPPSPEEISSEEVDL